MFLLSCSADRMTQTDLGSFISGDHPRRSLRIRKARESSNQKQGHESVEEHKLGSEQAPLNLRQGACGRAKRRKLSASVLETTEDQSESTSPASKNRLEQSSSLQEAVLGGRTKRSHIDAQSSPTENYPLNTRSSPLGIPSYNATHSVYALPLCVSVCERERGGEREPVHKVIIVEGK